MKKLILIKAVWEHKLSPEAYHVLKQKDTEGVFKERYDDRDKRGTYVCAACSNPLFSSTHKFNSGTGGPSFSASFEKAIAYREDFSTGFKTR